MLVLLVLFHKQAAAQLLTSFNLEAGTMWNMIKVDDPGNQFQQANVRSYVFGFTVGQELLPNLSVVSGVLYVPLNE